jgi:O-succinylbenzoate synthase
MKVKQFSLYSYNCNLRSFVSNRYGLIVKILLENKEERFGEVSPLPYFSKESLAQALSQLKQIMPSLIGKDILSIQRLLSQQLYPSVLFGMQSLLFPNVQAKGLVSGLLDASCYQEEVDRLLERGIYFAKIKLRSFSISDAIGIVNKILSYTNAIRFHLDINRKWNKKDLSTFLSHVDTNRLRYIEEPLSRQKSFLSFIHQTNYPFAFDESLRRYEDLPLDKINQLIIKPTMQKNMIDLLKLYPQKSNLSSSFESLAGIKSICHLAERFSIQNPLGIDTLDAFTETFYSSTFAVNNGMIIIDPLEVDEKKLTKIII